MGPWGLENDETNPRGYHANVLAVVLIPLTILAVLARFLSRYQINAVGLDDFLIIPSEIAYIIYIFAGLALHHAVPGSQSYSLAKGQEATQMLIVQESSMAFSMLFLKLSLGAFFLRLVIMPCQRKFIYTIMIVSTIVNFFIVFFSIFCCGNPKDFMIKILTDQCLPKRVLVGVVYMQAAVNATTDVLLACLPLMLLRGSRMARNLKVYVYSILFLATVGCVASIVRMWYCTDLFNTYNFYVSATTLHFITLVELGSGIIASSLATLRPLLRAVSRIAGGTEHDPNLQTYKTTSLQHATHHHLTARSEHTAGQSQSREIKMPVYLGEEEEEDEEEIVSEQVSPVSISEAASQESIWIITKSKNTDNG